MYNVKLYACNFTYVQTLRMYNTKSEPNVKYRLQVIFICPCRFIDSNKCGGAHNGGGYAYV